MTTRIAVVTDIHHGLEEHTKRGASALGLLEQFVEFVNAEQPDLVLDLGDRITDADPDTDLKLETEVAQAFAASTVPVHHICGNHDRDHLSVGQNEAILGQTLDSEVLQIGQWDLALWRADAKLTATETSWAFDLPDKDLLWLGSMAQSAKRPTLTVSHVPISNHSQVGNTYFHNHPGAATYPQHAEAREALEQAQHPMVFLSGHVHWNSCVQVNGIWHLTQQSLTESFTTQGQPAACWSLLELSDTVSWTVYGLDPFSCVLTPKAGRWTPPLG